MNLLTICIIYKDGEYWWFKNKIKQMVAKILFE